MSRACPPDRPLSGVARRLLPGGASMKRILRATLIVAVWLGCSPRGGATEPGSPCSWMVPSELAPLAELSQSGALLRGMLLKPPPESARPRIAVYFGTYDPPHRNHLEMAHYLREELGLDQVVYMVNEGRHKPGASRPELRLRMVNEMVREEDGLNVWQGFWVSGSVQPDGTDPLDLVRRATGAVELFEIVGQDVFEKGLREGAWTPAALTGRILVITMRPEKGLVDAASVRAYRERIAREHPELSGRVRVSSFPNPPTSSTEMRRRLGQREDPEELKPGVIEIWRGEHPPGTPRTPPWPGPPLP